MGKSLKTWWPGTELNRRRQPFQSVTIPHDQQLAGRGRLRNALQGRACAFYRGLHRGLQV